MFKNLKKAFNKLIHHLAIWCHEEVIAIIIIIITIIKLLVAVKSGIICTAPPKCLPLLAVKE